MEKQQEKEESPYNNIMEKQQEKEESPYNNMIKEDNYFEGESEVKRNIKIIFIIFIFILLMLIIFFIKNNTNNNEISDTNNKINNEEIINNLYEKLMSNVNHHEENNFLIKFIMLPQFNGKYFTVNQEISNKLNLEFKLDEKDFNMIEKNMNNNKLVTKEREKMETTLMDKMEETYSYFFMILVDKTYHYIDIDMFRILLNKINANNNFFCCFRVNMEKNEILIIDKNKTFVKPWNNKNCNFYNMLKEISDKEKKCSIDNAEYSLNINLPIKEISFKLTNPDNKKELDIKQEKIDFYTQIKHNYYDYYKLIINFDINKCINVESINVKSNTKLFFQINSKYNRYGNSYNDNDYDRYIKEQIKKPYNYNNKKDIFINDLYEKLIENLKNNYKNINKFSLKYTIVPNFNKEYFIKKEEISNEIKLNLDEKNFNSFKEQIEKNNLLEQAVENIKSSIKIETIQVSENFYTENGRQTKMVTKYTGKMTTDQMEIIKESVDNQEKLKNKIQKEIIEKIDEQYSCYIMILINKKYYYININIFKQIYKKIHDNKELFLCFNVKKNNNQILIMNKDYEIDKIKNEKFRFFKDKLKDELSKQHCLEMARPNNAIFYSHIVYLDEMECSKNIRLENKEISLKFISSKEEESLSIFQEKIDLCFEKDSEMWLLKLFYKSRYKYDFNNFNTNNDIEKKIISYDDIDEFNKKIEYTL